MATLGRAGRKQQGFFRGVFDRNKNRPPPPAFLRLPTSRQTFRLVIALLAFIALAPPVFFHFRLRRLQQLQLRKCGWLNHPPLVCAHGGDTTNAFPNTVAAYQSALRSHVDCIEIDVSRSSDGVLFALHDRDLQQISGNHTARVGHFSMKEDLPFSCPLGTLTKILICHFTFMRLLTLVFKLEKLDIIQQSALEFGEQKIPTVADALTLVSSSVRQVILDAKVGPPSYERGLAKDILSVVGKAKCRNCVIWAKSDSLARDLIKLTSDVAVGYIVMKDPNTGRRSNLLRMKGARVVGVYHPLVDEGLVRILQGRQKKVYTWTVDDVESMRKMLVEGVDAIVTNQASLLQRLMQDIRGECREEGFSLPR
ncbi:unnamed protein product [Linum tenue]|uniref:glycerophosphodiester phosphodiesterase n=1 Tax=Linum tenue TaxID=586396 RepID=A0AAV0NF55_9ROSI|nr:unnamed protein product [Linum tenue]